MPRKIDDTAGTERVLIVQYEQYFQLDGDPDVDIASAINETLEAMRMYAGGVATGFYEDDMSDPYSHFRGKAIYEIKVSQPTTITID